jgi:uncharacterized protein (DUF2267 family)
VTSADDLGTGGTDARPARSAHACNHGSVADNELNEMVAGMARLRDLKTGLLEVAASIEGKLHELLATYYFPNDRAKRDLFIEGFLDPLTLSGLVARFQAVLAAVRDRLDDPRFTPAAADELSAGLDALVRDRYRFAHEPTHVGIVENDAVRFWLGPVDSRGVERLLTVETAEDAYADACRCELRMLEVRLPLERKTPWGPPVAYPHNASGG